MKESFQSFSLGHQAWLLHPQVVCPTTLYFLGNFTKSGVCDVMHWETEENMSLKTLMREEPVRC